MNKAIEAFNLSGLLDQVNKRLDKLDFQPVDDIDQEINDKDDYFVLIVREPASGKSFEEPQNVPVSSSLFKRETVKVFCKEFIDKHDENKITEFFSEPGNVFNLALIYKKPEMKKVEVKKVELVKLKNPMSFEEKILKK